MSILDSLITDRTQEDVQRWNALAAKGYSGMTEAEKAEWDAGMKGAYNASDLNRVGNAVNYVAGRLEDAGYTVSVNPKIDWLESDVPTESSMEQYLKNVETIRNTLTVPSNTPNVPDDMEGLTYEEANDIERILLAVDALITNMINAYFYSNEIVCGEV